MWRERVQAELNELTERLTQLTKYMGSEMFRAIGDDRQRHLMMAQQRIMQEYQQTLQMRLLSDDEYRKRLEARARHDSLTGQKPADPGTDPFGPPA